MSELISVERAKDILLKHTVELSDAMMVSIQDALGCRLAQDINAPLDLPPFDQSNVDGYAVCGDTSTRGWNVVAEVKAGDASDLLLMAGEAVRIFTGAMVPKESSAVLMQEKVSRVSNLIQNDGEWKVGEHIRRKGAQIKKGELACPKGTVLTPSSLGFIASLGINEILVFKKPRIGLLLTGNELQVPGTQLPKGKIFESNSVSLATAVQSMGLEIKTILSASDDKISLSKAVKEALKNTDVLLISGGISVGDYDFVDEILRENNTNTLFYKVAQKPGKPLFFGKHKQTYVFGLPGNPASALTCFYEYVYPCLRKMQGYSSVFLPTKNLCIEEDYPKKKGLAHFLKAKINEDSVLALEGQESFKIRSFAEANGFIYLPLNSENIKKGELVEVHYFPSQNVYF